MKFDAVLSNKWKKYLYIFLSACVLTILLILYCVKKKMKNTKYARMFMK